MVVSLWAGGADGAGRRGACGAPGAAEVTICNLQSEITQSRRPFGRAAKRADGGARVGGGADALVRFALMALESAI